MKILEFLALILVFTSVVLAAFRNLQRSDLLRPLSHPFSIIPYLCASQILNKRVESRRLWSSSGLRRMSQATTEPTTNEVVVDNRVRVPNQDDPRDCNP